MNLPPIYHSYPASVGSYITSLTKLWNSHQPDMRNQGHLANVGPAIYGGIQLGIHDGTRWRSERVSFPANLQCIIFVPENGRGRARALSFAQDSSRDGDDDDMYPRNVVVLGYWTLTLNPNLALTPTPTPTLTLTIGTWRCSTLDALHGSSMR